MNDSDKTKKQLIKELEEMRLHISSLKSSPKDMDHENPENHYDVGDNYSNEHNELLKLVLTLSTNFIILSPEDIDEGINDVLRAIGNYAGVDRSYVFQFSEDGRVMSNTHEWCAEGILSLKESSQGILSDTIPWFSNRIKNFEIVYLPDTDDTPLEAIEERRGFLAKGIKSFIAVPIVTGYTIIGFLGFESVRQKRIWSDNIISLIRIVGEIFANAIVRKRMAIALNESESRYRNIFENTIEGIFQITLDGKLLSVNPSFVAMYGYDSAEAMTEQIKDVEKQLFIDPLEYSRLKWTLEEKGFIRGYELQSRHRDGSAFWTSMNVRVVRNGKNQILYFEGTIENINEKKKAEQMLTKEREIFSSILHKAPYGVILSDKEGHYLYVNPEFVNITGYTLEDVPTGREWFRRVFPDDLTRQEAIRSWKENIGKKNIERVYKIVCKNNEIKEIEFRVTATDTGETITMLSDVTERRQAEELFRTLANSSPVGVYIMQKGKIKFTNLHFREITGFNEKELIDKEPLGVVYPDDVPKAIENTRRMLSGERTAPYELRIITKQGSIKWILQSITAIQFKGRNAALASFLDISDTKHIELRLKESEERYRILTEQSPVGIYLIQNRLFRYVNKTFADIHGYMPDEIINRLSPKDLTVDTEGKTIEQIVKNIWNDKGGMRADILIRRKDGTVRNGEIYGSKVIYDGRPAVLGTLLDVTEKKQMEDKLKTLSVTDELTGLYNRRGFFTLSEQQFKVSKRLGKNMILFFTDMDGLKWVNDNIGHKEGDKVLVVFARILKNTFRESDIIGRLGGDEFAVLALSTGFTNPELLIKRLNSAVDSYNAREKLPYRICFSIGFVEYDPMSHNSLEELVSIADDLMYSEKKRKKERGLYSIKTMTEKEVSDISA